MNVTTQRQGRRLTELLTQQRDVYRQLCELAASQSQAVREDQPESLLRVLARRQELISHLAEVNGQLEPFRSQWDRMREELSPAQRLQVGELVDEVQRLLGQILQQDQADTDALQERSQQVRAEAASLTAGRAVNAAYAANSYAAAAGPRLIDRTDAQEGQP